MISYAIAQTLTSAPVQTDYMGIGIAVAVVLVAAGGIWYLRRNPDKLAAAKKGVGELRETVFKTEPTPLPDNPRIKELEEANAALLARLTPSPAIYPEPTLAPAPTPMPKPALPLIEPVTVAAPLLAGPAMPKLIDWPNPDGTPGKKWLYAGQNFSNLEEIVIYDLAVAERAKALENIDHEPLPLSPEQIKKAIELGGDPALRSSWLRPSPTYQSAVRRQFGWSPDDINKRINEANVAGYYGIWPKEPK